MAMRCYQISIKAASWKLQSCCFNHVLLGLKQNRQPKTISIAEHLENLARLLVRQGHVDVDQLRKMKRCLAVYALQTLSEKYLMHFLSHKIM